MSICQIIINLLDDLDLYTLTAFTDANWKSCTQDQLERTDTTEQSKVKTKM